MDRLLPFATLAYNTYNSPNLSNYSPYELVFQKETKVIIRFGNRPSHKGSSTYKEYYERLEQRLKYLAESSLRF